MRCRWPETDNFCATGVARKAKVERVLQKSRNDLPITFIQNRNLPAVANLGEHGKWVVVLVVKETWSNLVFIKTLLRSRIIRLKLSWEANYFTSEPSKLGLIRIYSEASKLCFAHALDG